MNLNLSLYSVDRWETAIEEVIVPQILDWQKTGPLGRPIWLIAPKKASLDFIKIRLLKEGAVFQVQALTPEALRQRLWEVFPLEKTVAFCPASREDRMFALGLALEGAVGPLASAARLDPHFWLKRLDEVAASGIAFEAIDDEWLRYLAERQNQALRQIKRLPPVTFDRDCLGAMRMQAQPEGAYRLLIFGFDAKDTALLPLLYRAVLLSHEAQVCVPLEASDALFTGSWEHFFGIVAEPVVAEGALAAPIVLEAETIEDRLITTFRVLQEVFGCAPDGARIVISSEEPGLLREVMAAFQSQEVAYYDAIGAPCMADGGNTQLQAWINYQKEGTLTALLPFLRSLEQAGYISSQEAMKYERAWDIALALLQSESILVLKAYFEANNRPDAFFAEWPLLPEFAAPHEFVYGITQAFTQWGEEAPLSPLGAWGGVALDVLPKSLVIGYLESSLLYKGGVRGPSGRDLFARIWVLPLEIATCLSSEYRLLLTSSSRSVGRSHRYTSFFNELNKRAVIQGCQGQGHDALKVDHGWVEGDGEQLRRKQQNRITFLQAPGLGSWLIADQASQVLFPDCIFQSSLDLPALERRQSNDLTPQEGFPAVKSAYDSRRAVAQPFGPYEYTFSSDGSIKGLVLPCRAWEELLECPVRIWYQEILGLKPLLDVAAENGWSRQKGIWAHEWVQVDSEGGRPNIAVWEESVLARAEAVQHSINTLFEKVGQPMPPLWLAVWQEALSVALGFVRHMAAVTSFPYLRQEVALASGLSVQLPTGGVLVLRGRMDAVLSVKPWVMNDKEAIANSLWVIDLKSSQRRKLTAYNMQKGYGLQLALYALALHAQGAESVGLSLLGADAQSFEGPQMDLEGLRGFTGLWHVLERIAFCGILGDRGENAFDSLSNPYPLATLRVDKRILEKKWALTHPEIATPGQDEAP